jgi:T-complex protein 11
MSYRQKTENDGSGRPFPTSASGGATESDTPPAMTQASAALSTSHNDALVGHYTSDAHQTDGPGTQLSICSLHPPPVTAKSLSELDIPQIVKNPKLRHDVGFDPNLHFRPNLDGEKGRRKKQQNEAYWIALHDELKQYSALDSQCGEGGRENFTCDGDWTPKKIPAVFEAIREILKTLVPERDHPSVDQNLDVPLIMQQLKRDILDVYKLSVWMGQLLKGHCAPMRDVWVDDMVAQIEIGTKNRCIRSLVGGLKSLFGILETMKLVCHNNSLDIRCR